MALENIEKMQQSTYDEIIEKYVEINSASVYMKGIDYSYYYEGYNIFKAEDL